MRDELDTLLDGPEAAPTMAAAVSNGPHTRDALDELLDAPAAPAPLAASPLASSDAERQAWAERMRQPRATRTPMPSTPVPVDPSEVAPAPGLLAASAGEVWRGTRGVAPEAASALVGLARMGAGMAQKLPFTQHMELVDRTVLAPLEKRFDEVKAENQASDEAHPLLGPEPPTGAAWSERAGHALKKYYLQTVGMVPPMAVAVGLPEGKAAQVVYWTSQFMPKETEQFKAMGLPDTAAYAAGLASSTAQAALMSFFPVGKIFGIGTGNVPGLMLRERVNQATWNAVKAGTFGSADMLAQQVVGEVARDAAATTPGTKYDVEQGWKKFASAENLLSTTVPMFMLHAPAAAGHVSGLMDRGEAPPAVKLRTPPAPTEPARPAPAPMVDPSATGKPVDTTGTDVLNPNAPKVSPTGLPVKTAEDTTPSAQVKPPPAAPPPPSPQTGVEFTTAKGSTYRVHEDGTTTRDKAARKEHPGESGLQEQSQRTFYVSATDAVKLGEFQAQGDAQKTIEPVPGMPGHIGMRYRTGKSAGKFERRTVVPFSRDPTVGMTPVETWRDGQRVHFGNAIIDVRAPAKSAAPEPAPPPAPAPVASKPAFDVAERARRLVAAGENQAQIDAVLGDLSVKQRQAVGDAAELLRQQAVTNAPPAAPPPVADAPAPTAPPKPPTRGPAPVATPPPTVTAPPPRTKAPEPAKPTEAQVETIAGKMDLASFERQGLTPAQVTRQDWVNLQRAERRRLGQQEGGDTANAPWAEYEEYHQQAVKEALARGEKVDPRVLKDYPELNKPTVVPPSTPAARPTPIDQVQPATTRDELQRQLGSLGGDIPKRSTREKLAEAVAKRLAFLRALPGQRVKGYGSAVDIVDKVELDANGHVSYTVHHEGSSESRNHATPITEKDVLAKNRADTTELPDLASRLSAYRARLADLQGKRDVAGLTALVAETQAWHDRGGVPYPAWARLRTEIEQARDAIEPPVQLPRHVANGPWLYAGRNQADEPLYQNSNGIRLRVRGKEHDAEPGRIIMTRDGVKVGPPENRRPEFMRKDEAAAAAPPTPAPDKAPTAPPAAEPAKPDPKPALVNSPLDNLTPAERAEYDAAMAELHKLLGRANMGLDPSAVVAGTKVAKLLAKGGVRTFEQYVRHMAEMAPELWANIRDHLRQLWEGAAVDHPEIEEISRADAAKVIAKVEGERQAKEKAAAPTAKPAMTFAEFEKQYTEALQNSFKYTPGQVGSQHWAERMAALSDAHPEWAQQVEDKWEASRPAPAAKPTGDVVDALAKRLQQGPISIKEAGDILAAHEGKGGVAAGGLSTKDVADALELAINRIIRDDPQTAQDLAGDAETARAAVTRLKALIDRLPTSRVRSPEMEQMQQFSTPPPLSFVANWVARVRRGETMLEPSAGTGDLAVFAKAAGARVVANELSPRRAELLRGAGIADLVTVENAEHLHAIYAARAAKGEMTLPSVVVMNPPFSRAANTSGRDSMVGARHVEEALKVLAPGGRLVAIVGQGMAMDKPTFRAWWDRIGREYAVRANVGVAGTEYAKYGTTFGNQLLVIDKLPPTADVKPITGSVERVEDLPAMLEGVRNERASEAEPVEPAPAEPSGAGAPDAGGPAPDAQPVPPAGPGAPGKRPTGGRGGAGGRPSGADAGGVGAEHGKPEGGDQPAGGRPVAGGSDGDATADPRAGDRGDAANGERDDGRVVAEPPHGLDAEPHASQADINVGLTVTQAEAGQRALNEHGVYSEYAPAKLRMEGAQPHPTPLVEPTAMAAVDPPDVHYQPALPHELMASGALSLPQLEQVVYAGQAHERVVDKKRMGYFIGDGTGVGKGREIVAIIMDNWNRGRKKAVWISASAGLVKDAADAMRALGFNDNRLIDAHDEPKKVAAAFSARKEGVAFMPYSSLRTDNPGLVHEGVPTLKPPVTKTNKKGEKVTNPSRIHLLADWLGKDFDGVIVFDESHLAGNAIDTVTDRGPKKASLQGKSVTDLQALFPLARIVYSSATGATDVTNLSYADRMGIWGPSTPFTTKQQFFDAIRTGGLSAMEIVARDLKAMGRYLARTLSFEGVTHEQMSHELSDDQKQMFDAISEAWQHVLTSRDKSMAQTGAANSSSARSAANSHFYGAQQRFFNQLLTAMELPSVMADMRKRLDNKESVVLQLSNTNEATLERELLKRKNEKVDEGDEADLRALDLSPRSMLLEYLNAFPTQKYQEVTDQNGNTSWEPVVDAKGEPVQDPVQVAERDRLIRMVGKLKMPENPIEQVLNLFGAENVAEVTGRSQRVVQQLQADGSRKEVNETGREDAHRKAEAQEFQDGKRRILLFSAAGGTGFSYHASKDAKNQQRRNHYLIQAGWRADVALQGFGRTHRSNQAQPPHYVLASTNLRGHQRFISTIARRLAELGALTGGERKAAGGDMFKETSNLQNVYGERAVDQLIIDSFFGKTPGLLSFRELSRQLGFIRYQMNRRTGVMEEINSLINPRTGTLAAAKMPELSKFLNRILAMDFKTQNAVFDAFMERMQANIERAKESGNYDPGLQTLKAQAIRKVSDESVYQSPDSTAATRLVDVEHDHAVMLTNWNWVAKSNNFVRNRKSGRVYSLSEGPLRTLENGNVVPTWNKRGPTGDERVPQGEIGDKNYEVLQPDTARALWEAEVAKAPKVRTRTSTYVVGTFLPIWDRLQLPQPKIWRIKTDAGENMLGAEVPPGAVDALRQRLSAGKGRERSPDTLFRSLMDSNAKVTLANGWELRRVKALGEVRLEVTGVHGDDERLFGGHWGGNGKGEFGYTERIDFKSRYFIPTDDVEGVESLTRILAKSPVLDMSGAAPRAARGEMGEAAPVPAELRNRAGRYDKLAREVLTKLPGAPDVRLQVVHTRAEAEQYLHGEERMAEGEQAFFTKDTDGQPLMVLIADAVPRAGRVRELVLHEIVGHYGLDALATRPEVQKVLRGIYDSIPGVERRRVANLYGMDAEKQWYDVLHEYLAQRQERPSWRDTLTRWTRAVQRWYRRATGQTDELPVSTVQDLLAAQVEYVRTQREGEAPIGRQADGVPPMAERARGPYPAPEWARKHGFEQVDESQKVPWAGATSHDGKTLMLHQGLEDTWPVQHRDGRTVQYDPRPALATHEGTEGRHPDAGPGEGPFVAHQAGGELGYVDAHNKVAVPKERAVLTAHGIDHASFDAAAKPWIARAKRESTDPAELHPEIALTPGQHEPVAAAGDTRKEIVANPDAATPADLPSGPDTVTADRFARIADRMRVKMSRAQLLTDVRANEDMADWYGRHKELVARLFGPNAELFERILAVTSQATDTKGNVAMALRAYGQMQRGEPFTGFMSAAIGNLNRIRNDEQVSGPKIGNYTKNNVHGDQEAVTVDRHIARMLFGSTSSSPTKEQYAKAVKIITELARTTGLTPAQVQATLWAASIRRQGKEPATYESYLRRLEAEGTIEARIAGLYPGAKRSNDRAGARGAGRPAAGEGDADGAGARADGPDRPADGVTPSPKARFALAPREDKYDEIVRAHRANGTGHKLLTWFKGAGTSLAHGADVAGGLLWSRVQNVDPSGGLRRLLFQHEAAVDRSNIGDKEAAAPLWREARKKMPAADWQKLDYALALGDRGMIEQLASAHGLDKQLEQARGVRDAIVARLREVGINVDTKAPEGVDPENWEYWPRWVKDYDGLVSFLKGTGQWTQIERAIADWGKAHDRLPGEVTEEEQRALVNDLLRGHGDTSREIDTRTGSHLKARTLVEIPPEAYARFYHDSGTSMEHYITSLNRLIEQRKLFGETSTQVEFMQQKVTAMKDRQGQYREQLAQIQKDMETATGPALAELVDQAADLQAQHDDLRNRWHALRTAMRHLSSPDGLIGQGGPKGDGNGLYYSDTSIGAYATKLIEEHGLDRAKEKELRDILVAMFHPIGLGPKARKVQEVALVDTLAQLGPVISQTFDLAWSVYENGAFAGGAGIAKALLRRSEITRNDVEDAYRRDFKPESTLDRVLQRSLTLMDWADKVEKESIIGSSLIRARTLAKRAQGGDAGAAKALAELRGKLEPAVGKAWTQTMHDLMTPELTPGIKDFVRYKLAEYQPVGALGRTEGYLRGGNARILYTLKNYQLSQYRVLREHIYRDIRDGLRGSDKGKVLTGLKNAGLLAFWLMLAGGTMNAVKDFLYGRKVDPQDFLADDALYTVGVSRWDAWNVRDRGLPAAIAMRLLPPAKLFDNMLADVTKPDEKGLRTVRDIPLLGELYYWHLGGGAIKEIERAKKAARQERTPGEEQAREERLQAGAEKRSARIEGERAGIGSWYPADDAPEETMAPARGMHHISGLAGIGGIRPIRAWGEGQQE